MPQLIRWPNIRNVPFIVLRLEVLGQGRNPWQDLFQIFILGSEMVTSCFHDASVRVSATTLPPFNKDIN